MKALLALLAFTAPAQAQTLCAPLTDALAGLSARYAETPRASALMSDGQMLIITASEAGGFTVLIVTPDGLKTMYDGTHWTMAGAAIFGRRAAAAGWHCCSQLGNHWRRSHSRTRVTGLS